MSAPQAVEGRNPPTGTVSGGELLSIQYLRAAAAIAVLCYHGAERAGGKFGMGAAGVDVFFVISGFIMWVIAARRPLSAANFLSRRAARIVPLYWAVTLGLAGFAIMAADLFPNLRVEPGHVLKSLFFIPHRDAAGLIAPLLVPGWTLNYEVFFYAVFALVLLAPLRLRLPVLAAALVSCVSFGFVVRSSDPILATYTDPLLLEFLAGALLGAAWLDGRLPKGKIGAVFIAAGAVMFLAVELLHIDVASARLVLWGMPAAMVVLGALSIERAAAVPDWPVIKFFGDASYSLYLVHGLAISFATRILAMTNANSPPLLFAAAIACGLVAGSICYLAIERPLQRMFYRSFKHQAYSAASGDSRLVAFLCRNNAN